jgi:hypothetical protein
MSSEEPVFCCQYKEGGVPWPVAVVLVSVLVPIFHLMLNMDFPVALLSACGLMVLGHVAPGVVQKKTISIFEREIRVVRHPAGIGNPVTCWPLSGIQKGSQEARSFMGYHFIRFRTTRGKKVTLYFPDAQTKAKAAAVIRQQINTAVSEQVAN